jgi:hypothetical protein
MEKFLAAAAIGWNPADEVRRRHVTGTLTFGAVLGPFIGVVVASRLLTSAAYNFFLQCYNYALGQEMPGHPIFHSKFAVEVLATAGALLPIASVLFLPRFVFVPIGRSGVGAAMLAVVSACAFYQAVLQVPAYTLSAFIATSNPNVGALLFIATMATTGVAITAFALVSLVRILKMVIGLGGVQVAFIVAAAVLVECGGLGSALLIASLL